jgi:hypothetical protein
MCPYQIEGAGDVRVRAIFGADTMQALILALHTLPTELMAWARKFKGSFSGSSESDLGLHRACKVHLSAPEETE